MSKGKPKDVWTATSRKRLETLAELGATDAFPFVKASSGYIKRVYRGELSALLANPSCVRTYTADGICILWNTAYIMARVWGIEIPPGKVPVLVKPLDIPSIPVNLKMLRFVDEIEDWRPVWTIPSKRHEQPRMSQSKNPQGKRKKSDELE